MRTLLENITFVKGVEYLIVVAFCLAFIVLWLLVHKDRSAVKKMVSVLIPLSLIFGGGAIVLNKYFDPDITAGATQSNGNITGQDRQLNINPDYFTIDYGSATEFHKIMSDKVSCSTCHHNSKEILSCKNCHGKPFNLSTPNKPGLKAAYHQRCMQCHKNKFDGPDSCIHCHTGKPLEISVPKLHKLTWENCGKCHTDGAQKEQETKIVYHDNCLTCHTKGAGGAAKMPADHIGRERSTCQGCHKQMS